VSELDEKAALSIHDNFESNSNETDVKDFREEKNLSLRFARKEEGQKGLKGSNDRQAHSLITFNR
jgi:hypothetical protein